MSVTFLIVDLWQSCVCFIRSGLTRCTLLWCSPWTVCSSAAYTRCSGRTSVHLCTASLQNLAVQQDFYSLLVVPLERSCKPRIRWCGTGGFQEQGQCFFIGLSCSIPTIVFYSLSLSLLSVYRLYCGAGVFRLIECLYHSLSTLDCRPFLIIIIIISLGPDYQNSCKVTMCDPE